MTILSSPRLSALLPIAILFVPEAIEESPIEIEETPTEPAPAPIATDLSLATITLLPKATLPAASEDVLALGPIAKELSPFAPVLFLLLISVVFTEKYCGPASATAVFNCPKFTAEDKSFSSPFTLRIMVPSVPTKFTTDLSELYNTASGTIPPICPEPSKSKAS